MAIVITDEDARRLLSMEECIEAMRVAFADLGRGKATAMPRMRYTIETPDPARRYFANVHIGAVASYGTSCVRAGSHFILDDDRARDRRILSNPDPVNWSVIILYDLATAEPIGTSARNRLRGIVAAVEVRAPGYEVTLDCGQPIRCKVTGEALNELGIRPGLEMWAVFKASSCFLVNESSGAAPLEEAPN